MLFDLTQVIRPQMPIYPGTRAPKLRPAATFLHDGYRETTLKLGSHTGTHMDAPAHMLNGRRTLDQFEPARFCGTAAVIDCTRASVITMELLQPHLQMTDRAEYLLFRTGWDRLWQDPSYFSGFPVMDEAVAHYCARTSKKGVGVDTISVDAAESKDYPIHRILLGADLVIVENLCNLGKIGSGHCRFFAMPLLYENADGAPVRAMAEIR